MKFKFSVPVRTLPAPERSGTAPLSPPGAAILAAQVRRARPSRRGVRMVPRRSSLLACLSTVVLAATVLIGAGPGPAAAAAATTTTFADIPGDGVTLKA